MAKDSYSAGVDAVEDEIEKKEEEEQAPVKLASISDVYSFGQRKFCLVAGGFIFSAISGCVFPAMAFIFADSFQQLGASVDAENFLEQIRRVSFLMMGLGVIAFVAMTAQATLLETAAGIMSRDLKNQWFKALLRQDMAFYDIKDVSGTATIISSNGAKFKKGTGRKVGEMIQFTFTFIGGMGYAFWASWRASLITLAVLPFMSLSAWFVVKINTSQTSRANETYATAGGIVYTTVSSIRTVLSLNAIPTMVGKFKAATKEAYEGAASLAYLMGLANGSLMGSFLLAYVGITLYGSFLLYDAIRNSGCDPSGTVPEVPDCDPKGVDIFGALMGITFAAAVLPQVSVSIEALTGARAACYEAVQTIKRSAVNATYDDDNEEPEAARRASTIPLPKYVIDSSSSEGKKLGSVNGAISFNNVTFSYPTRRETNVFDNFSLTVGAGKTVALVGASGSGKSTSVQLIERFYDPTSGSITLDGTDLKDLNVNWLRSQIGLVGQEPSLFARNIRENIRYGKPDATQAEIEQAARNANCHDFITAFPDGYDTQVGDKGAQLSGGQKQRVAIARVLIKNPKILLLDEATSALDSESEVIVQAALDELLEKGGRTTLVIAHRLSTVRHADMIVVVDEGKVVETGTHTELLDKKAAYHRLVEAQKGSKDGGDSDSNPGSRTGSMHNLQDADPSGDVVGTAGDDILLRFSDVHFRYPSRPDNKILRGMNLDVYDGETLALVGPSGHGKSTIIQLVERFYDPDSGFISLHDVSLKNVNVSYLRDTIGLVSQEPTLFDTTISENIRYGKPGATQEEIVDAAKKANVHETIMAFPEQYDTLVGSGGTLVSGGQKQRISIARALVKKPKIMLLDEATSALDSASEKIVQAALDEIMSAKDQTTIVIAHRLSTIRHADRIAVIEDGRVREIGSHDELMANEGSHYRRLQMYQDLETDQVMKADLRSSVKSSASKRESTGRETPLTEKSADDIDKESAKKNSGRAWLMASEDRGYFFIGSIGAVLAGLIFPGWGFIFAYMIELLYSPLYPCELGLVTKPDNETEQFDSCSDYQNSVAEGMKQLSFNVTYGYIGTIAATMIGNMLLFYGFNVASERMNKRVRDSAFTSLVRQEVGYFDMHPVSVLTSRLSEDAAKLQAFAGEPIRTLIMNLASVAVGLAVSFYFMWPFACICLAILPFMAFGAEAEMAMYMGEDEGDAEGEEDEHSPGAIVVETLLNIRTVASLNIEESRADEFDDALAAEDKHPYRTNMIKGSTSGLGQFTQMWGIALMFWWGGWLLSNYQNQWVYRDFLISMFSLLFSLSGLGVAAQGATDRDKAKVAADRIFELTDRESAIDPLSDDGVIDV